MEIARLSKKLAMTREMFTFYEGIGSGTGIGLGCIFHCTFVHNLFGGDKIF